MRIVDDEMRDVRPGEVGEIVYRGPTVMHGYSAKPRRPRRRSPAAGSTAATSARDEEGFLVVDRKKDMIICGGENIYPAEVERVLRRAPGASPRSR